MGKNWWIWPFQGGFPVFRMYILVRYWLFLMYLVLKGLVVYDVFSSQLKVRHQCRETNWVGFSQCLPCSNCCLNIWLKVQSSWQIYCPHNIHSSHKYLQHNIHTIVQVQYLQCRVLSTNSKSKVFSKSKTVSVLATLLFIGIRQSEFHHCYWMQHALGMSGSPTDECNLVQTSLDELDMFDLCLVINCRLKENIKSFKL